jgi:biotin synthase
LIDSHTIGEMSERALSGEGISEPQALRIAECSREELVNLLDLANRTRQEFRGSNVKLCGIVNAKSGRCAEDCAFCAQSSKHKTDIKKHPLLTKPKILAAARKAAKDGAKEFSIVTSGRTVSESELARAAEAIGAVKKLGLSTCASLGILGPDGLEMLAGAGLDKYHHNLETSRSFFPEICTTHSYDEDVQTISAARDAGLQVCCGGIFGLGETRRDWVELAGTLRELEVDSVPLNFLNPVKGTRLADRPLLGPLDALRVILIFRLVLPRRDIVICGGREVVLRDLQCMVFFAGANGLMLGDYLTTRGRDPKLDTEMIRDLELLTSTD